MTGLIFLWVAMALGSQPSVEAAPTPALSVCDLARDPLKWNGRQVRIASKYVTDLRHGAFFVDKECPLVSLQEDPIEEGPADESVAAFDAHVSEHPLAHKLLTYEVQIVGTFHRATSDLRTLHGLQSGVFGEIRVEKVVAFAKVDAAQ